MSSQTKLKTSIPQLPAELKSAVEFLIDRLPGQHEAVFAAVDGVVHEEPVLFKGPPGTGKTLLITYLAEMLDMMVHIIQMTKYSTDAEVLGMWDIKALQEGKLVRNWSNIVRADMLFLDEVFDAPSYLLRALHGILNERIVYDPYTGQAVPIKASVIFAASNYIPTTPELQAVVDRFPVKVEVNYVPPNVYKDAIMVSLDGQKPPRGLVKRQVIEELRKRAMEYARSNDFLAEYITIAQSLAGLREFGAIISDRTLFAKLPKIIASTMVLLNCPPSIKGCTMYTAFLIMPWVININTLQLPDKQPQQPQNPVQKASMNVKDALAMPKAEFTLIASNFKDILRDEIMVLAGKKPSLLTFEHALDTLEDVLKMRKWYSPLLETLEWRLEYLRSVS